MRILISKFKSIGDVLLITPLLRNLKTVYPESCLDVLVPEGTDELIRNNPYINKIYLTKNKKKFRISLLFSDLKLLFILFFKRYDLFIATDKGDRSAILAKIIKAKISIGRPDKFKIKIRNPYDSFFQNSKQRHIIEINQDPLRVLKKEIRYRGGVEIFHGKINNPCIKKFLEHNKKFIHIHPFSQAIYKEVDSKLISKIVDFCEINLGIKVVITGSSSTHDLLKTEEIVNLSKSDPEVFSGKLTLSETAYLNKFASILIVVDTAVMHISCANRTPVVALFGPTAVNSWGPWDIDEKYNNYSRSGGVQTHGIHSVIASNMSCVPCSESGCAGKGYSNCLNEIDFEIIKKEIVKKLK